MDILYTVEEKYLEILEEFDYGEPQKALHLLKQMIQTDPDFARAYYHLGCVYHYKFKNYQNAGYYYEQCLILEPEFPDVYLDYLKLLITLERHKMISRIFNQALQIKGTCKSCMYEQMGLYCEKEQRWTAAHENYRMAMVYATDKDENRTLEAHLLRVKEKKTSTLRYIYSVS